MVRSLPILSALSVCLCLLASPAHADIFGRVTEGEVFGQKVAGKLTKVAFASAALGETRSLLIYTPPGYQATGGHKYPVLVLLHGTPGGMLDWAGKGDATRTLDRAIAAGQLPPTILVYPDGHGPYWKGGSEWADDVAGKCKMASAIGRDLPHFLREHFAVSANPNDWTLGGLSEGGYGAANIVVQYPNTYRNALVFSGDLQVQDDWGDTAAVFGTNPAYRAANSPSEAVQKLPTDIRQQLRFFIAVGADDDLELQRQGLSFVLALKNLGGNGQFVRDPGKHNWTFWSAQLGNALKTLGRWLGEARG